MRKVFIFIFILLFLNSCVGSSSKGVFGTGVSIALDPRTLGTQIDDSIMQKNLQARLALTEKKYLVTYPKSREDQLRLKSATLTVQTAHQQT